MVLNRIFILAPLVKGGCPAGAGGFAVEYYGFASAFGEFAA